MKARIWFILFITRFPQTPASVLAVERTLVYSATSRGVSQRHALTKVEMKTLTDMPTRAIHKMKVN